MAVKAQYQTKQMAKLLSYLKTVEGTHVKVKASGGVRTREDFDAMIKAGAERIGTSAGTKLM